MKYRDKHIYDDRDLKWYLSYHDIRVICYALQLEKEGMISEDREVAETLLSQWKELYQHVVNNDTIAEF